MAGGFGAAMAAAGTVLARVALALFVVTAAVTAPAAADEFHLLRLDGAWLKWGKPALGEPATVTWKILDGRREDPDGINCRRMTGIDGLLDRAGVTRAAFRRELTGAFALWRDAAGLQFVAVDADQPADIVVGAQAVPRGVAYTNVAYEPPAGDVTRLTSAAICLNPAVVWEARADGDSTTYNLRRVLAHEIGHAIGLDHPGRFGALMAYAYADDVSTLRDGDVAGVRTLYGPLQPAMATVAATVGVGR